MLEQVTERLDRLEVHLLQFRQETRDEFSAVRAEVRQQGADLRGEMRQQGEELRGEMRGESTRLEGFVRSEVDALAALVHNEMVTLGVMLTDKIDKGFAENAALSRSLHEDLVGRIAALGGRVRRKRRE